MISERELEDFLIESNFARYHPAFVATLCARFNLNFNRIRQGWKRRENT